MGDVMSGVGGLVGGIVGDIAGSNNRQHAIDAQSTALQNWQQLQNPQFNETPFQQYTSAGNLNPTLENTVSQGNSGMQGIKVDPNALQAQKQALASLQNIGNNGGLTAMDKAQLNQISTQQGNQTAQANNAILQNAAQRGMASSGTSIAAQLAAQQNAATNASNQGFNVAAQAQQRALSALQGAGQMGNQIQNTQFGEQAAQAQAQDAINRFNAQNSQSVQGQNVQRQNYSDERNLNNNQNIGNMNTNLQNQQQQYNNTLAQQGFQDSAAQAQGYGAQADKYSGFENNLAAGKAQAGTNIGKGIGGMMDQGSSMLGGMMGG